MRYLLTALLVLGGCTAAMQPTGGCSTDDDCKGDRICDARTRLCIYPPDGAAPSDGRAWPDLGSCSPPTGKHYRYATNALLLPNANNSYAIDVDGSGRSENQLQSVISAIGVAGFDVQGPVSAAVADGEAVFLLDEQSADFVASCATVTMNLARVPATPPTFAGNDNFQIDTTQNPAVLTGEIGAGQLSTALPKNQTAGTVKVLGFKLPFAGGVLPLTIYGAQVQGNIAAAGIMSGQIHGAIRKADINNQIIPALATLLTNQIQKDPMGSDTSTLVNLFVTDPTALAACNADLAKCTITAAEVQNNSLIQNVLAPDIQAFNPGGQWDPIPNGANKDSLSVGLGFTAVADTFE